VGGLSAQAKIEVLPAKLLEIRIVADSSSSPSGATAP
jgi:hypothetical protein